jgi:hypothetical protein
VSFAQKYADTTSFLRRTQNPHVYGKHVAELGVQGAHMHAQKVLTWSALAFGPSSEAPTGWLALAALIGLPVALWTYKVSY